MTARRPADIGDEIRFTRVASGARIAWARSGRGPVLVRVAHWMTHVGTDTRSPVWQPWLERLGRDVELVRYDERGCGASEPDDVPLGLDAAVEELAAVIDACGAAQVALLGQSGAAAPAIAYAARHPTRVSHLVVLGGYLTGLMQSDAGPQALAFQAATEQLIESGWGRNEPAVQQFFSHRFIPDASAAELRALTEQQRLSCNGARAAAIVRARARLDVRALAPQVRCPTLVLHAEHDGVVPVERGREVAAAIPGARFVTLPTRHHIPLASDAAFETFCSAVARFVSATPAGPALTPRERALAEGVALGLDNAQLAARLGLADKTVRNALSALYTKLEVEGRPQAVVRTRELGFGSR